METINISETNNEVIITLKGKIDVKKAAELDNILKDLIENKKYKYNYNKFKKYNFNQFSSFKNSSKT